VIDAAFIDPNCWKISSEISFN